MFCNVINDKCIFQPEEIQIFFDTVFRCKVGVFVRNIKSKFILTQELNVDCIGIIYIRQRFINKPAYFRIKHRVKFLGLTVVFAGEEPFVFRINGRKIRISAAVISNQLKCRIQRGINRHNLVRVFIQISEVCCRCIIRAEIFLV